MSCQFYNCSVKDLKNRVDKDSVDLILTDPPYPEEYLFVYRDLAELAVHCLKPGGSVLAMSGNTWMPELFKMMDIPGIRYNWMLAQTGIGGGNVRGRMICNCKFKLFLWYIKPPADTSFQMSDEIYSAPKEKGYHEWGQSEAEFRYLIDRFRRGRDEFVVVDPFLGGGTTAISAEQLGVDFIGCDTDPECVKVSKERIEKMQLILL